MTVFERKICVPSTGLEMPLKKFSQARYCWTQVDRRSLPAPGEKKTPCPLDYGPRFDGPFLMTMHSMDQEMDTIVSSGTETDRAHVVRF